MLSTIYARCIIIFWNLDTNECIKTTILDLGAFQTSEISVKEKTYQVLLLFSQKN